MEIDPAYLAIEQSMLQQTLFGVNPPQSVQPEFFPILWEAAEALTSPELPVRQKAWSDRRTAQHANRRCWPVAVRGCEPDVALRALSGSRAVVCRTKSQWPGQRCACR
jgi:hypothetical protein